MTGDRCGGEGVLYPFSTISRGDGEDGENIFRKSRGVVVVVVFVAGDVDVVVVAVLRPPKGPDLRVDVRSLPGGSFAAPVHR